MPLYAGFIGGAYRARSRNIDCSTLVNAYVETTKSNQNAKQGARIGTPGLRLATTASDVDSRGWFSQDGRTFGVVGTTFGEVDSSTNTFTSYGTIPNDGNPVSFASNGMGGQQLAIVGGGVLKIFTLTTNTLSSVIPLPLSNVPVQVAYLDTSFMLSEVDSVRVWFSALADGTSWDALDFFAVSQTSSNVIGILALKDRLWVFQSQTTSVYYDTGDTNNPFQPYPGSVMHEGAVTPWALALFGEEVLWLSQDTNGHKRMVTASDYNPVEVSTPAIDFALDSYTKTSDCEIVAVYEMEGHIFGAFTFPSADATWVVDLREGEW